MKKILCIILILALSIGALLACGITDGPAAPDDSKVQIVTTIFPAYDWVTNILGENPADMEVTMLMDNGVDLHSYQPSVEDITRISSCDLFIYVGGESDGWVEDALKEATNKDMKTINLLEVLGDAGKEEEMVEGMQETEDEDEVEDADTADSEADEEEAEYDEHVWLSLKNATTYTDALTETISNLDPDNATTYEKNASDYKGKLSDLDTKYEELAASAPKHTLLFGDRFPFRYLVDDYGITYYAAFSGCSAETEASFETITFLAEKVDELGLGAVLIIDGSDGKIAETIVSNTDSKDQQILTLNSLQSTTSKDVENGSTYLSIMKDNLNVLKQALN